VALGRVGVGAETAMTAALSFHALETCAAVLFGLVGVLLARLAPSSSPRPVPRSAERVTRSTREGHQLVTQAGPAR
jgi:hypothetical protein